VFCLSPLGDTLFATPAIRALRENCSKARIIILASPPAAEVLRLNPFQMKVIKITDNWDLFKMLTIIRKENYDLALSLSKIGSYFTRFCATPYRGDFFSIDDQYNRPVVQRCLEVLQAVGLNSTWQGTEFWFGEQDRRIVDQFLKETGYNSNFPLIAIHCGGHYFTRKRWPTENFIQLIKFLKAIAGLQVVLIGGAEDVPNTLVIRSAIPDVINATGMLKLSQTAALLKRCRLLIGNDSGPLHLGAAVQIPTIGLFGPTDPYQFYPYNPPAHRYIYKALPCSPCYKFGGGLWQYIPRCSKAYCMELITPEEVAEKAVPEVFQTNLS
jgi:ADP-heptose:LPS heptosyltransferase